MSKAKVLLHTLLLIAIVLGICHLAYSGIPAAKNKAHSRHKGKKQTARPARKAHKRAAKHLKLGVATYTVTATAYQAVASQTDTNPFITADNSTIRRGYSSKMHWLAVSQDLLKQRGGSIRYGDKVRVRGISPQLDGIYTVHDTMHRRHRHRIDILSSPREKLSVSTKNVQMRLVKASASPKSRTEPAKLASTHAAHGHRVASRSASHCGRAERLRFI